MRFAFITLILFTTLWANQVQASEDQQKEVYENVFTLTDVFPLRSCDELKGMLNEHYFMKVEEEVQAPAPVTTEAAPPWSVPATNAAPAVEAASSVSVEDDIDELLKDL